MYKSFARLLETEKELVDELNLQFAKRNYFNDILQTLDDHDDFYAMQESNVRHAEERFQETKSRLQEIRLEMLDYIGDLFDLKERRKSK